MSVPSSYLFSSSTLLPKPYVHEPCKDPRDEPEDNENEIKAFDLLLIDHAQQMIVAKICFLPQNVKYVMRFKQSEADEPQNREHQTDVRDSS